MNCILNIANGLWANGHFYSAVLVFLPVQVGYVLAHNLPVWFTLILGNSYRRDIDSPTSER